MTDLRPFHTPGKPLILFNIWDAGSASAVAKSGAPVIATGSWAVARSQGFDDGQVMPFTRFIDTTAQIIDAVSQPVTVDFEGGFADDLSGLKANIEALLETGACGLNFEDRVIGGQGLHDTGDQCERIKVLRAASVEMFINARCDLLFMGAKPEEHSDLIAPLIERAKAYAEAGADGLFAPGLTNPVLIERLVKHSPLPVNIMRTDETQSIADLADLGVARISHGPMPYLKMMSALGTQAKTYYEG